jgi:hypothetical protein
MHCANSASLAEPVAEEVACGEPALAPAPALLAELLHPATAMAAATRATASGPAVTGNFLPFVVNSMDPFVKSAWLRRRGR